MRNNMVCLISPISQETYHNELAHVQQLLGKDSERSRQRILDALYHYHGNVEQTVNALLDAGSGVLTWRALHFAFSFMET